MSFERSGGGGISALASGEMAAITPVVPSALNLAMGTRQVTVPLAFLPGPSLAPPLHLAYRPDQGNGPFGLGWALPVPYLCRQPLRQDRPADGETQELFFLAGTTALIPIERTPTRSHYRLPPPAVATELVYYRDPANDWWELRDPAGQISRYGAPGVAPPNPAVITDPGERSRVVVWLLTSSQDPQGNELHYEYARRPVIEHAGTEERPYLRRIQAMTPPGRAQKPGRITVVFDYERRPDPFADTAAGVELATRYRCTRITVQTTALAERVIRRYGLHYRDSAPATPSLPARSDLALLAQLTAMNHSGEAARTLAPLVFDYTRGEPSPQPQVALNIYVR